MRRRSAKGVDLSPESRGVLSTVCHGPVGQVVPGQADPPRSLRPPDNWGSRGRRFKSGQPDGENPCAARVLSLEGLTRRQFHTRVLGRASILGITSAIALVSWLSAVEGLRIGRLGVRVLSGRAEGIPRARDLLLSIGHERRVVVHRFEDQLGNSRWRFADKALLSDGGTTPVGHSGDNASWDPR